MKDEKSDIHLLIGRYTATDFSNVNFAQILLKYAGNKYNKSGFRENVKRLLKHRLNKTGPFKVEGVAPWYTSAKTVSRGYALLYMMHMDPTKSSILEKMTAGEIWASHPEFKRYDRGQFETYNKNMINLTSKRKELIKKEEAAYQRDLLKLPQSTMTSRGIPFWHKHAAKELLKKHVESEMSGSIGRMKPVQLWKSRAEYQDFPLAIFRKHIYQERTKQLAAPYWQYKRNKNARKRFEEAEEMLKEWSEAYFNKNVDALAVDLENIDLGNDEEN